MKVNDERKAKTVPFNTIKYGEPFTDEQGDFMMRVRDIIDTSHDVYNVVNLETGEMYIFEEDQPVIRINRATLTVYD